MENVTYDQLVNMSDDEIANLSISQLSPQAVPQELPQATDGEVQPNGEHEDTDNQDLDTDHESDVDAGVEAEGADAESQDEQTATEPSDASVDLEGFYKVLTAPIKAAGREIVIESAEEAVRLIQMGVDYSRKNAEHKRDRSVVRGLEDRGIGDPETLGFLADVHAGKPEALAKLFKQHNLDPFELDIQKADDYVPSRAEVPEQVIALDEVLTDLRENSPTYDRTLSTINSWDEQSRLVATRDPNFIRVVDAEIASGRFEKVDALVHRAKTLGHIPMDTPYLEAYRTCEVEFNRKAKAAPVVRAPRPKTQEKPVSRAGVSVPTGGTAAPTRITTIAQIANLSDDEILKLTL